MIGRRADSEVVPSYKLFGEHRPWPTPEPVHYETIAERSALHDWEISPHSHDNLVQVLFLEKGDAEMTLETRSVSLPVPCLVFMPARVVHGFRFSRDILGHIATLPEFLPGELLAHAVELRSALGRASHCALSPYPELLETVRLHFAQLAREYRGGAPGRLAMMLSVLAQILVTVARATDAVAGEGGRSRFRVRVERFAEMVERHFREWRPLSFYADRLGVSSAQLNTTCRRETGLSAQEMIHQRLLLEARRLLVYSDLDVTTIGYALGFRDPAYFTRFFSRAEGVPPSVYRARHVSGRIQADTSSSRSSR